MQHHIVPVSASTIGQLDNEAFGKAVDRCIRTVIEDIANRPCNLQGKTEKRKVVIEMTFEPCVEMDEDTRAYNLTRIILEPSVKGSVPTVRGGFTEVRLSAGNVPKFNRDNPRRFDQPSLPLEVDS